MATKRLAKELGLLRQRSTSGSKKQLVSNQIFSYIIVIDFESTCWKEKNNYGQEIIEFPAVLLNTSTGEVESEFHTYVQPQEHPILSDFCTELTGITQPQVEAGVPLQICLSRFSRWLQNLQHQKGLVFHRQQNTVQSTAPQKLCTFLTWSDWDLGVCLQYECKRKQINKPSVLNSWIDLRSTYRLFYNRKPKGLNGALQDLGIQFEGREHSGLDDSRNTAQLTARMMRDGCVMRITRSLDRIPVTKATAETKKPTTEKHDKRASTIKPSASSSFQKSNKNTQNVNRSSIQESLVSPKTLLNGTVNLQEACKSITNFSNLSSIAVNSISSPRHNNIAPNIIGAVQQSMAEGFSEEILVETEERCGSYDDVVLDIFENGIFESEETVYSITNSDATTMECNRGTLQRSNSEIKSCFAVPNLATNHEFNHSTKTEAQIASARLKKSKIMTKISSKPQVLVHNTPSFPKTFPKLKPSTIYTDPENVAENHYKLDLGRSEETMNSADTFTDSVTSCRAKIPQSKTMGCSNSKFMQSKSTNSGLEMCFTVPYPVGKSKTNFSARKQPQMFTSLLNKSEIGPTNPSNPQVLVPNTPSFPKTIPKRKDPFTIYTNSEDPSTSHTSTFNSREVLANLSNNMSLNGTSRITSPQSRITIYTNPENVHYIPDLGRSEEAVNSADTFKDSASFAVPYPVSIPKTNFFTKKQPRTSCLLLNKSEIGPTNPSKLQILVPSTAKTIPKRKQSFTISTDSEDPRTSHNSTFNSRNVLSNLSTNMSLNGTLVGTNNGTSRITAPLCLCGRRAKRQTVSNGGPNHGRGFFCCPVRRSGTLGRVQKGCEFFKWESAVLRDSFAGASVSMCQVNTSCQQPKGLRKSF